MPLEKAIITNTVSGQRVPVLFNPEEYAIARDNNFAQVAIPGLRGPLLQFVAGNMQTLDMELLVDSYEANAGRNTAGSDVRLLTAQITGLMDIDPTTHAPPVLLFTWGSLSFTCVLARANQRFIMFRADGVPVRARLQVTFNEFINALAAQQEVKTETADYSHVHVVHEGDSLSSIAAAVYDDPGRWRPIAIANGIDRPKALVVGSSLRVPQLPFRDPGSGELVE
ncbi:MAG: LysM peptidoglycan-binding domain-containing protein [Dehalococcoidia bacterium]